MSRIQPLTNPTGKAAELLGMVQKKMGRVPNMMSTLANSPAALEMYLTMSGLLGGSSLSAQDRERLALLAAKKNACGYCEKAHTAIGKHAGLSEQEISSAKDGVAQDARAQALLAFSAAVLEKKGHVSDSEFAAAKQAGLSDAEILDVVATTCLNIYTNYVNHVADPVVDF
ncbi:MAG: carboxymuconolactone decarboxylase family protein [Deltaproteobacteria bacterium]|nr:carboxymuconolactone decarboxylase family protein [Deltaproteobacteria bacterium]